MNTIKSIALFVAFIISTQIAGAQSIASYKSQLQTRDTQSSASVIVREHGDAEQIVSSAPTKSLSTKLPGYRVCIFFDNGVDARVNAQKAKNLFVNSFGNHHAELTYDIPYYKVTVGNCISSQEAIVLLEKVSHVFPKAFIKSESVTLESLISNRDIAYLIEQKDTVDMELQPTTAIETEPATAE